MMIDAGWGMFQFNLGTTELQRLQPNTVVPPMEHGYVHLGAGIRFPIVPGYLSALLEGAGRIGTSIGAQTRNVWGVSSEPSNGFVTALELRVSIPEIDPGVFVAVRGQYFQLITAFAGQVTCALADGCFDGFEPWEDDQPWELWPEEPGSDNVIGGPADPVTDHYFRLQLQVGYAYY